MTSLYFTADLRSARVCLPDPPESLWLTLRSVPTPQPAWLLTPATYARIWWKLVQIEDRWAEGGYPREKLDEAMLLFAPLTEYAGDYFAPAQVEQAQAEIMTRGPAGPLPHPGPCPANPWSESSYVYDGTTGRFRATG